MLETSNRLPGPNVWAKSSGMETPTENRSLQKMHPTPSALMAAVEDPGSRRPPWSQCPTLWPCRAKSFSMLLRFWGDRALPEGDETRQAPSGMAWDCSPPTAEGRKKSTQL
jgi:hypothetical protein